VAQRARKTAGAAAGALPFFTLLAGDDTVSRERARTQLLDRIRAARGEITVEIFDSEQQTVAGLTERVLTPSLFGGVRVFVVPHAESLDTEELAELEQLLGASLTDEYVVVEGDKPGEDHKALAGFVRKAEKRAKEAAGACQVVTLLKPPPWKTADWLVANTPVLFGRRIDRADAEYLVERAGDDYDMLRSELEKIDLYLDEGKPVTREAIAGIVEGTREAAAYELAQALGRKEIGRALGLLDSLFSSSFYPPACIGAIYRHFWSLLRIRAFEQKEPETVRAFMRAVQGRDRDGQTGPGVAIGKAAGLFDERQPGRVYSILIKSRLVEQARSFSDDHLRAVFRWLHDIDVGVKTGRIDAGKPMMQALCIRVVRGPERPEDERAYAGE